MFGGVTLDKFCPRDVPRILACIREGKAGIAELCEACVAAIDAVREEEDPTPTPRDCPAPWKWIPVKDKKAMYLVLRDATGQNVLETDDAGRYPDEGQGIVVASPLIREQIRLAGEMAALLHDQQAEAVNPGCGCGTCLDCRRTAIVTALDAIGTSP